MDDVPYFYVKATVACNVTLVKFPDATRRKWKDLKGLGGG
jgi:hypothetical protein